MSGAGNPLARKAQFLRQRLASLTGPDDGPWPWTREHGQQAADLSKQLRKLEEKITMPEVSYPEGRKTSPLMPDSHIGMSPSEVDRYSLVRALRCAISGDWREGTLELEASDATAKRLGRESRGGFLVPMDWMQRRPLTPESRDQLKGTASAGGYMVGTELLGASFIDRLTAKMVMAQAGVTFLTGLVGDVAIPRLATGPTSYWVAENTAPTEGAQTFEQVTLAPKTNAAYIDISRRLLSQASLDVENMVRNDLARSVALALDKAILQGAGTNEPTGLLFTTGVTDVSGTDGDTVVWASLIEQETTVATANADVGKLAYITNPTLRGDMKSTLITATYGEEFLWDRRAPATPVNGYPCYVTSQIPATSAKGGGTNLSLMFFGNWADVIVGSWGSLDILIDPYTGGIAGTVRVICHNDTDVAVRHPASVVLGYYT